MRKKSITFIFLSPSLFASLSEKSWVDVMAKRFIERNKAPGLAIAIFFDNKEHFFSYGTLSLDENSSKITPSTLFEIGSITKVFTGLLLALAVEEKRVKLRQSIGQYLPYPLKGQSLPVDQLTH